MGTQPLFHTCNGTAGGKCICGDGYLPSYLTYLIWKCNIVQNRLILNESLISAGVCTSPLTAQRGSRLPGRLLSPSSAKNPWIQSVMDFTQTDMGCVEITIGRRFGSLLSWNRCYKTETHILVILLLTSNCVYIHTFFFLLKIIYKPINDLEKFLIKKRAKIKTMSKKKGCLISEKNVNNKLKTSWWLPFIWMLYLCPWTSEWHFLMKWILFCTSQDEGQGCCSRMLRLEEEDQREGQEGGSCGWGRKSTGRRYRIKFQPKKNLFF